MSGAFVNLLEKEIQVEALNRRILTHLVDTARKVRVMPTVLCLHGGKSLAY